jgi:hypothetical protein
MKLTTHLCLVPRLRVSGAIPLLSLHAFMAWAGTALPFIWSLKLCDNASFSIRWLCYVLVLQWPPMSVPMLCAICSDGVVDFMSPSRQKLPQVSSPVPWVHALTNNSNATVASACGHGWTRGPDPRQRVVALHAAETWCTIIATTHVQQPVKATGTQTAPLCAHRCDGSPLVHLWVVALSGGQVRCSIIPAC